MSQHCDKCPTTYFTFLKKLASFADFFPYQNVHKKTYLNPSDLSEKHYYYYGVFYTSGNVQRTTTKMTSCLYAKKLVQSYTYIHIIYAFTLF